MAADCLGYSGSGPRPGHSGTRSAGNANSDAKTGAWGLKKASKGLSQRCAAGVILAWSRRFEAALLGRAGLLFMRRRVSR